MDNLEGQEIIGKYIIISDGNETWATIFKGIGYTAIKDFCEELKKNQEFFEDWKISIEQPEKFNITQSLKMRFQYQNSCQLSFTAYREGNCGVYMGTQLSGSYGSRNSLFQLGLLANLFLDCVQKLSKRVIFFPCALKSCSPYKELLNFKVLGHYTNPNYSDAIDERAIFVRDPFTNNFNYEQLLSDCRTAKQPN